MLELLHIENIAIIEEAEIAFRPGFNALTGETGAGKSVRSARTERTSAAWADGPSPCPSYGRWAAAW